MTLHTTHVLSFDGKDDFLTLPEMTVEYDQGFTLEAWICWGNKNLGCVLDICSGLSVDNILLAKVSQRLALYVYKEKKHLVLSDTRGEPLSVGIWQHVAATIDASGAATLYEDGKPVASGQVHVPSSAKRSHCYLGRASKDLSLCFEGQMTEVRLWNIARTGAEIEANRHRRLSGTESGLVAYFPLDDGQETCAHDASPAGLHATISGAVWEKAEMPLEPREAPREPLRSTGLEDYAYWQRWSQSLPTPEPGEVKRFRRGVIWR